MMSSPLRREVDVAVIGGGPAGAAAATRLARWGYSVVVLTKPNSPDTTLGNLSLFVIRKAPCFARRVIRGRFLE
jgi:thioredoxin reductase